MNFTPQGILLHKEFCLSLRVNKEVKKLFKCQNKKTQNDHFIITYSKFPNLKLMDQFQSLLGSFSEFFSPFSLFLVDLLQIL